SRRAVKSDVRAVKRQADEDIDTARLATRLSSNSALARAQALLPAGTDLQKAAAGFEDARQFLLSEHVAPDLNIPFAELQAKVTGANRLPLEQAVSMLRPDLSSAAVRSDLNTAWKETRADFQGAGGIGGVTEK